MAGYVGRDAVIVGAVRTPIGKGKAGGALHDVLPVDLLAHSLKELVGRTGIRNQGSAYYVPLGVDATVSVSRLDVGVTLDLAGQVSPSNGNGYFDLLTVRGFAQVRI